MKKVTYSLLALVIAAASFATGYTIATKTTSENAVVVAKADESSTASTQSSTAPLLSNSNKHSKESNMTLTQETKDALKAYAAIMQHQTKLQFDLNSEEEAYLAEQFLAASKGEYKFEDFSDEQHKGAQTYLASRAQKVQLAAFDKISKENLEKGKVALEEFAKEANAVKDPSGLVYVITKEGTGEQVKETDTVSVTYKGTHLDGSVFDQQLDDKKPVEFPLDRVIPGFKIALSKLKVGGSIKVMIPADLAYGEHGAGQSILPNETLVFEVTVHGIKK